MNTYEITFLSTEKKESENLLKLLESFSGVKKSEKSWGKRTLAYPIDKKTEAEYNTWIVELTREKMSDFKKKLNFENIVMRYLILEQSRIKVNSKTKSKTKVKETEKSKTN